jgi:sulfopyruvate decarboxylase subunit alpha
MFSGDQIVDLLTRLEFTHVVFIPDSTIGQWDDALSHAQSIRLVRACREGEAWEIAAGLHLGGARPLVLIQCTGLFESGDALRNVVHDWKLPVYAMIGYRSYLSQETLPGDTCLTFTEPILAAWQLDTLFIKERSQLDEIERHCRACRAAGTAGVALIAEGKA